MGFLDKLRKKKDDHPHEAAQDSSEAKTAAASTSTAGEQPRRVKRYTSEGKPVYE
ncbi:MAG TPA: hypothetical protein VHA09_02025 [Nitrososphaera sp.]|nr:hypothetical protein [Nitrososphaera sp.]